MPKYPSPCDTCYREDRCNKGCLSWDIRYRYRQKQINAYAKKLCGQQDVNTTAWVYMHPDDFLRYLASDPCEGCLCEKWCDDPCPKYLAHFADKMEHIRKRAESHGTEKSP